MSAESLPPPRPVLWRPRARRQLREIGNYIAKDSPKNACEVIEAIEACTVPLGRLPNLHRPSQRVEGAREIALPPYPYLVIYEVRDEAVYISAVVHGRRMFPGKG